MANVPKDQTPLPYGPMALHAAIAAVVFFALNRFMLEQSLETALMWGAVAAPFAAYLAYTQARR